MPISDSWDRLLATRWLLGGNIAYVAYAGDEPVYTPAFQQAFSSVLLVDLAALLDAALTEVLAQRRMRPRRKRLADRINAAANAGVIPNAIALHALRELRNTVAHDWNRLAGVTDLDPHLREVHDALVALGYSVRALVNYVLEIDRPVDWAPQGSPPHAWERETEIAIRTEEPPLEYLARYQYVETVGSPDPHDREAIRIRAHGRWEWP